MHKSTKFLFFIIFLINLGLQRVVAQAQNKFPNLSSSHNHLHSGVSCENHSSAIRVNAGGVQVLLTPKYSSLCNWLETPEGDALVNSNGTFFYAKEKEGRLISSGVKYVFGKTYFKAIKNWKSESEKSIGSGVGVRGIGIDFPLNSSLSTVPSKGNLKIPVFLMGFKDYSFNSNSVKGINTTVNYDITQDGIDYGLHGGEPTRAFNQLFNGPSVIPADNPEHGFMSMKDYYSNASNNLLNLDFTLPVRRSIPSADNNALYYGNQNGEHRTMDFVHEAIVKSLTNNPRTYLPPSNYDSNGDGYIEGVVVIHAGPGLTSAPDDVKSNYIWPRRNSLEGNSNTEKGIVVVNSSNKHIDYTYDRDGNIDTERVPRVYDLESRPGGGLRLKNSDEQVWVYNDYAISAESQFWGGKNAQGAQNQVLVGIGTIAHEFGHLLGMPDIYVNEGYSVGNWDIMAGGAWASGQYFPTDFSAYTKNALGWIQPEELYADRDGETFTLKPSTQGKTNYFKVKTRYSQDYFLLENRTKNINGNDIAVPAEGMLIWHLFERVADLSNRFPTNLNGSSQFDFDPVDIEEADGTQNKESEATDVWPGILGKTEFGSNTFPNSSSNYDSADTKIRIHGIKQLDNGDIEFTLDHKETEAPEPSYCQNKAVIGRELGITQVAFGQVNNPSPWTSTYHYDPSQEATVSMNQELELEVFLDGKIQQDYQDVFTNVGVKAFIDWNADGDFDDDDETVFEGEALLKDKKRYSTKVTVPQNLAHNSLRYLRVVTYALNYSNNTQDSVYSLENIKPCASEKLFKEGENEDYRIKFVDESIIDIPNLPTDLNASHVSGEPQQVQLTWTDNSSDETSFYIFATDHTGLRYEKVAEVPAGTKEVVVDNLLPSHKYFFRVQAIADPISSSLSDAVEITTLTDIPKNFYWVGNGGDWTDLSHWATTSGGSEKQLRMPSKIDNIIFDENSFTKVQQAIVFTENIEAANIDMMAVRNRPEFTVRDPNLSITVYGDLKLPKGIFGSWGTLYLKSIDTVGDPAELIFESDEIFYNKVYFDAPEATGAWTLKGKFYGNIGILNQGILSFDDNYMRMREKFEVADTPQSKILNLDDGELETGSWNLPSRDHGHLDAFTFTQNNSTLTISTAEVNTSNGVYQLGSSFYSGGFIYNELAFKTSDLRLSQKDEEPKPIVVNNSIQAKELFFHSGAIVEFGGTNTITFEKITADGLVTKPILLLGNTTTFKNIGADQPIVRYAHVRNIDAVGDDCFRAESSISIGSKENDGWCSLLKEIEFDITRQTIFKHSNDVYAGNPSFDIGNYFFITKPFKSRGTFKYKIIEGAEFAEINGLSIRPLKPGLVRISMYIKGDGSSYGDSKPYNDLFLVILDKNQPNKFVNFMQAVNVIGDNNFCYGDNTYPTGPNPTRSNTPIPTSVKVSTRGLVAVASQNVRRVMIWKHGPGVKNNNKSLGNADYVLGQTSFTDKTNPSGNDFGTYTNSPGNIAFSPDGNMLAVADRGGNRVLIYKDIYATMAKADERALNGEEPYIMVEDADIVLGRSSFGLREDYTIDKYPTSSRVFNDPKGMSFTQDGKFIVCDGLNNRVLIWNEIPESHYASADVVVGQTDMVSDKAETSRTGLNDPSSVAISRDGKMIIADAANQRVLIYNQVPTSNGAIADLVLGQKSFFDKKWGLNEREFSWPYGVAVDSENRLAISEYGNNRVVVYNEIPTTNYAAADVVLGQPNFLTRYDHDKLVKDRLTANSCQASLEPFQRRIIMGPFEPSFDAAGRLYTAGWKSSQVKVFGAEANKGDLKVEISSSLKKPQLGDIFDVKINFEHKVGYDAHHVKIDYTLPAGLELVENPVPSVGEYDPVDNQWKIDQIIAGQSAEMDLKVTLKGEFQNEEVCMYSTIHSNLLDTNPDDNTSSYCLNKKKTVQIVPDPIANKKFGDPSFSATVNTVPAGLPIKYNLVFPATETAIIEGNRITIQKPGSFIVEYIFEGNDEYKKKTVSEIVSVDKGTLDFVLNMPVQGGTYQSNVDYKIDFTFTSEIPDKFADLDIQFLPYKTETGRIPDNEHVEYDPSTQIIRFKKENPWIHLKFAIDEVKYAQLSEYFDLINSGHRVSFTIDDTPTQISPDRTFEVLDRKPEGQFDTFDNVELTLRPEQVFLAPNAGGNIPQEVYDLNAVTYKLLAGEGEIVSIGTYQQLIDYPEDTYWDDDLRKNIPYPDGTAEYNIALPKMYLKPNAPGVFIIQATIPKVEDTPYQPYYNDYGLKLNLKTFNKKDTVFTFEITRENLSTIAEITEFKIPTHQIGDEVIDQAAGTITINVSSEFTGKFTPIVVKEGAHISPDHEQEVDASQYNPVYYVTAENDDHVKRYEIIINRELSCRTAPEYFEVEGLSYDIISGAGNEIAVEVPQTVDLSSVNVIVGLPIPLMNKMSVSPKRVGRHDFSGGFVDFVITAECGTKEAYKVLVTHEQPDAAKISSAKLNDADLFIAGNQMSVTFPAGTDISTLELSDVLWKVPSENPRITNLTETAGKYPVTLDASNQAVISTLADNGETLDYTLNVDVEALPGVSTLKVFKVQNEVSNVIDHATGNINVEVPITTPDMTRIVIESVRPDDINASLELIVNGVLQSNTFPKIIDATKSISLKVIPTNGGTAKTYSVNISKQSLKKDPNLSFTPKQIVLVYGGGGIGVNGSHESDVKPEGIDIDYDDTIIYFDFANSTVSPLEVGKTQIKISLAETDNYKSATAYADVEVKKAKHTGVVLPSASDIFVGEALSKSNLSGGDSRGTFTFKDDTQVLPLGDNQSVKVVFTPNDSNYQVEELDVSIDVKAIVIPVLTVTASAQTKVYGDTEPTEFTYTVTGFVNGDTKADVLEGALSRASGETVNVYAITNGLSVKSGKLYTINFVGTDFAITKAPLTVTANAKSKTLGDVEPALDYVVTGLKNGDLASSVVSGSLVRESGETATTYAINAGSLAVSSNYSLNYVPGVFTISAQPVLTVTASAQTKVYGDTDPTEFTYTVTGFVNGDTKADVLEGALSRASGETVNVYAITNGLSVKSGKLYTINFVGTDFAITKAPLTVTANAKSKTLGDVEPALDYVVTGLKNGDLASSVVSGSLVRESGETATTYAINAGSLAVSSNYSLNYVPGVFTISAQPVLTVTASAQTKVYGDTEPTEFTYTVTGFVNGDTKADVLEGALSRASGETVNVYAITNGLSVKSGKLYTINFVGTDFAITKAPLTVTANAKSKTLGDVEPALDYVVTGLKNGDLASSVVSGSLVRESGETATTYAINAGSLAVSSNYSLNYVPGIFTISAQPVLTVTASAQTKVYGDTDPTEFTYTVTGFVNGDTKADVLEGALSRASGETVNVYAITNGLSVKSGKLYTINFVGTDFAITKAPLTVTANAKSKTLGDVEPALDYVVTGLKNGDLASSVVSGSLVRESGETATTYAINAGSLAVSSNYSLNYVPGIFTISAQPVLTVTASAQTKVYGDTDPTEFTYTVTGFVNGDTKADVLEGALSRASGETVNVYAITNGLSVKSGKLYTINFVGTDFAITKAPLTVTANAKSKTLGDVEPALDYVVTGLKNGDLASSVVSGSLVRESGETATTYAINAGSLAVSSNYSLNYVPGVFTISAQPVLTVTASAQTKVYGDTEPTEFTYTVTGFVNGDTKADVLEGALSRASGETVNVYAITNGLSVKSGKLYTINFVGTDFAITKAPLTVTANAKSKTLGDVEPALDYVVTGLKNGDLASSVVSGSLVRESGETATTYAINAGSLAVSSNYSLNYVPGVFTISAQPVLTVTASAQTKVYGDTEPTEFTYTVTGFVNGDTKADVLEGALSRASGETVNVYAITNGLSVKSGKLYTINYVGADLSITKASLTVTANPKSKTAGDNDPALDYSVSGLQNGDNNSVVTGDLIRETGESVGDYEIQQGTLTVSSNYTLNFNTANFEITNQPVLTVTVDANQTKVYGGSEPVLTYEVTDASGADFDASAILEGALSRVAGENAGTYRIEKNSLSVKTGNFYTINFESDDFTITPARLTVTADNESRVYGTANPSFTLTYTTFVNGDDANSLLTPATAVTLADGNSVAGGYDITVSGATSDNYDISFVKGTLTVTDGTTDVSVWPTLSTITYGEALSSVNIGSDGVSSVAGAYSISDDSQVLNAGVQKVNLVFTPADVNYSAIETMVDVEIKKVLLQVSVANATKAYGTENPDFSLSYDGFVNREDSDDLTIKPTGISLADKTSILGNYDITISGGVSTNYSFEYGSGTLEIEKGTPEVTVWPSLSEITLGEALTEVIFTGGSATVEGTYAIVNPSRRLSEGTHDVDLIFTPSDLNYNKVSGQSKVKVGKRVIRDNALIVSLDIRKHNSETSLLASEHEVVIDEENLTIEATVYEGVDLSKVNLAIGFKDVNSNPIVSPSENRKVDLTDLSETITVNNGEDALVVYTLKVKTVAVPEPILLSITSFEISGSVDVQINESEKTIAVKMPKGSDLTNLVPRITLASEKSKVSPNTGLAQDFSNGSISYVVSGAGEEVSYKVSVKAENDVVLGSDDLLDMELKAYPNPTSGKINLNVTNAKAKQLHLSLSDLSGRVLRTKVLDSEETVLDISNLNTGIYLLSVTSGKKTKIVKIEKR